MHWWKTLQTHIFEMTTTQFHTLIIYALHSKKNMICLLFACYVNCSIDLKITLKNKETFNWSIVQSNMIGENGQICSFDFFGTVWRWQQKLDKSADSVSLKSTEQTKSKFREKFQINVHWRRDNWVSWCICSMSEHKIPLQDKEFIQEQKSKELHIKPTSINPI